MITVDPLSVATQGFIESQGPTVSTPRDALRIATLGWIIVDDGSDIDVGAITDVIIENPWITLALLEDNATSAYLERRFSAALLDEACSFVASLSSGATWPQLTAPTFTFVTNRTSLCAVYENSMTEAVAAPQRGHTVELTFVAPGVIIDPVDTATTEDC